VLSLLCDAVVHLGPEHHIIAPAPKLAALLHAATRPDAYLGESFEGFIPSHKDKSQVKNALKKSSNTNISDSPFNANVLQIGMRDVSGIGFDVELFYTPFQGVDGQRRYVVGINEVGARVPCEPILGTPETWMKFDLPERVESDRSASNRSLGILVSELPLRFATNKQVHIEKSNMVEMESPQVFAPNGHGLFNALWRRGEFVSWVEQTTHAVLGDEQVVQSASANFQFETNSWTHLNLPPCSISVLASHVNPGSGLGVEHSEGPLVRLDVALMEKDNDSVQASSLWFDTNKTGELLKFPRKRC